MTRRGRRPVACGIDIGTTNTKAVVIDEDGAVVARAARPTPRDADGLLIEPSVLLSAVADLVARACGDAFEVHAISSAGVGEDGILADTDMNPVTLALGWFDPRRQSIFRTLRPELNDDLSFDVDTDPARTLTGWKWARTQNKGDAAVWLSLADLPLASWTSRPFLSDSIASRTAAWRSVDRTWDRRRVEACLGDLQLLPPVRAAGEIVGDVLVGREDGPFAPDAIAVAGGHDHPIGAWGVHQMEPYAILDSMGTAEVVVATRPVPSGTTRDAQFDIAPAVGSDGVIRLRVEELTRNVTWAAQDPEVAVNLRALLAGTTQPDPVLDSGYFQPGVRGGGRPAYAAGAPRDAHARASAVLGALAHAGRRAIEALAAPDAGEVRLAGGWIRSPGWIEIKAAVNGYRTAAVLEPEVTAVGAALLAARARGWTPDPVTALAGLSALSSR